MHETATCCAATLIRCRIWISLADKGTWEMDVKASHFNWRTDQKSTWWSSISILNMCLFSYHHLLPSPAAFTRLASCLFDFLLQHGHNFLPASLWSLFPLKTNIRLIVCSCWGTTHQSSSHIWTDHLRLMLNTSTTIGNCYHWYKGWLIGLSQKITIQPISSLNNLIKHTHTQLRFRKPLLGFTWSFAFGFWC